MPAATPLPRGPSVLTLYDAADLLTAPGCPVCRYAAEAADRYLGWFALEGHSQPQLIATMRASLGMCATHTRHLIGQPGSAIRLAAVYRYVVMAARDLLASRKPTVRRCPACEHDDAASSRALSTLLDGLASGEALSQCRNLGGVCIPHLTATVAAGPRRVSAWLADTMRDVLAASSGDSGWLAGTGTDARARAELRRMLPATGTPVPGACLSCLMAAGAERDSLASLTLSIPRTAAADPSPVLCAIHLADVALAAAEPARGQLLATQARCATARKRSRRAPGCPACRARSAAEEDSLDQFSGTFPAEQGPPIRCVRHHLRSRGADRQARADSLIDEAELLAHELTAAFEETTRPRHGPDPAPRSTAALRAAAFIDGGVFGGRQVPAR